VVWGRGETAGETWRTGLREEAHSRCIAWTTAFAVSVASIGGSLWEIADLDEGTIAAAIGVCAVSFFTSIVTGIQASESADAGTRLGRFWQGLTLGLRVLGVMSIFGFFTVGPLAVLVFAPPRRGAGAAVTLLIAAFGLVMTVVTALKVRR
jgi:FtsH-binding integral membrane protein